MIDACIIGVSGFGRTHYADLIREAEAGRMRPVAATVVNQAEESERCARLRGVGCELFDEYRAMLAAYAGKAQLCFIPTGIPLHAPMTIDALGAGMNVYVEKPAAPTVQDVRAMQEMERASGRFVAVGYQHNYSDATLALKERLVAGEFGSVRSAAVVVRSPRPSSYYARNGWAGRVRVKEPSGGDVWVLDSPFNNANAHYVNLMCFWSGETLDRSAELSTVQAELYRANPIESADTACIRATTPSGGTILYLGTHTASDSPTLVIRLRTDCATITWSRDDETIRIRHDSGAEEALPMETNHRENVMRRLHERFVDPSAFICTLEIAGAQTMFANGAFESSDVRALPERHVSVTEMEGDAQHAIDDIEDITERCFDHELLFSEAGVPWAFPGTLVDLTGYGRFTGGAMNLA